MFEQIMYTMLVILLQLAILLKPCFKILKRAGLNVYFSALLLVPGTIGIWILAGIIAFKKWPNELDV